MTHTRTQPVAMIGIDPGTELGIAVVLYDGRNFALALQDTIHTKSQRGLEALDDIFLLYGKTREIPDAPCYCLGVAVEHNPFWEAHGRQGSVGARIAVSQARWVEFVRCQARHSRLPLRLVNSAHAKRLYCDNGHANKAQILRVTALRFGIEPVSEHAADACMLAYAGLVEATQEDRHGAH